MFNKNTSKSGEVAATPRVKVSVIAAIAALGLISATPAVANGFGKDVGSSERVNLSGQLGTLSQRITAAACNLSAGVAMTEAQAVLSISTNHYNRINRALLEGNRGFGILGKESRPRTLRAIDELNAQWEPLQELANATQANANDAGHVADLYQQSHPVQAEAKILVSEITGQYADPVALLHADAFLLEIAGRQRMLSNKMSTDVCLMMSNIEDDAASTELRETMQLFETSLNALRNGMESVGLRPPPTEKIAAGLGDVATEWEDLRPILDAALGGVELSEEVRGQMFLAFLGMEATMNNVVHQYQKNSKLKL